MYIKEHFASNGRNGCSVNRILPICTDARSRALYNDLELAWGALIACVRLDL